MLLSGKSLFPTWVSSSDPHCLLASPSICPTDTAPLTLRRICRSSVVTCLLLSSICFSGKPLAKICSESNFIHRFKHLWLALVAFMTTCFLRMAHDTCLDEEKRASSLPSALTPLQHLHPHPHPVWQLWRTPLYSLQCSLTFEMFPEPRVCLEHAAPLSFLSDLVNLVWAPVFTAVGLN